ncbi:uncharacterized protein PHALS_02229 [Plasmopara halstedii]|uniref:Uncharacterized protein n=1 Tax=Plasmopara halstedii TaxID=4781 RepID=A0A0P1AUQ1_PLAHL|nr:uncharacterized protein PHALS_02229 [Plasmopara halstedii]CEG45896.1 hypothetical protein PHALS_02229 [Plasmopara halstedii]|eukprot:XP_024582265.1 hypothetical protein PHALS_02229 [Plasmopara halstedii]
MSVAVSGNISYAITATQVQQTLALSERSLEAFDLAKTSEARRFLRSRELDAVKEERVSSKMDFIPESEFSSKVLKAIKKSNKEHNNAFMLSRKPKTPLSKSRFKREVLVDAVFDKLNNLKLDYPNRP